MEPPPLRLAGNRTLYTYNARGELTAIQDPLAGFQRFRYSATGTLLEYEDQGGHTTTFTYDSRNRRLSRTDPPVGTRGDGAAVFRYEYDRAGRLTAEVDPLANRTKIRQVSSLPMERHAVVRQTMVVTVI